MLSERDSSGSLLLDLLSASFNFLAHFSIGCTVIEEGVLDDICEIKALGRLFTEHLTYQIFELGRKVVLLCSVIVPEGFLSGSVVHVHVNQI